jgi:CRP/FNR family transcriptional regulator, cyclic AMP receptor protein
MENTNMRTRSNSTGPPLSAMAAPRRRPISKAAVLARNNGDFDPEAFLAKAGVGRTILELAKDGFVFSQGDPADAIYYIQKGRVKLTVVSHTGKEATIALLGTGEFMGEDCIISDHPTRRTTATALMPCTILRIHKAEMVRALHAEQALSDLFVAFLLTRNARIQEDLVDQLFNSSEKRLARILLLLAHFGKPGKPETMIPKISQETLAQMIGTTRSRVSFFMNRFRKLGFINYSGGSTDVHSSLLNVILHD